MSVVLTLILVGVILLALEVVLPGLVAGIAGLTCLGIAVAVAYREFGPPGGHLTLLLVGATLVSGFFLWLRFFPDSRLGRRFVSRRVIGDIGPTRPHLLHRTGHALTNLRPSGTALLDGQRIDVVTEGPMVERGTPVRVVAVEGLRVVVRAESP